VDPQRPGRREWRDRRHSKHLEGSAGQNRTAAERDHREGGFSVCGRHEDDPPFSTPGSSASLLRLAEPVYLVEERRCGATVEIRDDIACSITSSSLTPALTAESSTNLRPEVCAIACDGSGFQMPGGPQRITEVAPAPTRASSCAGRSSRVANPGEQAGGWPATSSRLRGRIRTASGSRRHAVRSEHPP
jgi:hypothetical protein